MSTTLRPWLQQYITALPKPNVPLPTAAPVQITDYSTEPPTSPTALPRVTATVSDGRLRIRARVDEAALRSVRDSTPLPQWRGAIVALDGWTLSYTAEEFVLQLHAFHVLQAVGSSDIGSARHCMDDPHVRHTHAVVRQVNTQPRRHLLHTHHTTLFPNQPLPAPDHPPGQPLPADLAAARPATSDLGWLYCVPEPCQRELDKLMPVEDTGGAGEMVEAGASGGAGYSQWSSESEKEEKEPEYAYFSQYTGLRPPVDPRTHESVPSLISPPIPSATLSSTSASSALPVSAVDRRTQESVPPLISPPAAYAALLSTSASSALPPAVSAALSPAAERSSTAAPLFPTLTAPSLPPSRTAPPNTATAPLLAVQPSSPQPHQSPAPPSPSLSLSSASSSQPADDAPYLPPASQHNLMETSLERDAMQLEADDGADAAAAPPPSQPSQPQLAQPREDESSLSPSQPSDSSQLSMVDLSAAAAEPFADDGFFFMTQAPSVSDYASQPAASQAMRDGSMGSDSDVMIELDESDRDEAAGDAGATGADEAHAVGRQGHDAFPASMPPLSPGPPSPSCKVEETKEHTAEEHQTGVAVVEAVAGANVERRGEDAATGSAVGHFSAEMITRRQRERNTELLRLRQDTDQKAAPQSQQPDRQPHRPEESKQQREQQLEDQLAAGHRVPQRAPDKRVGSSTTAGGSERPDKRRRLVRFDDNRNTEHEVRDDTSDGSSDAGASGQSLADMLRGVSVDEVVNQPMAVFDGWSGDDFAWHQSYWKAVQL